MIIKIKNRKRLTIAIDGIKIGDKVFKDGKLFRVVALKIYAPILNIYYKESSYSIKSMLDEDNEILWNIVYDGDRDDNINNNLWVHRYEVKIFSELDFNITKDTLKVLKKMYKNGGKCNIIACSKCPLKVPEINCSDIVSVSSNDAKSKLRELINKFKKYLRRKK